MEGKESIDNLKIRIKNNHKIIKTNGKKIDDYTYEWNFNKDNFNEIKSSNKTVLLDFYADWCGPCRMVSPIVEEIAEKNHQYLVGKINVDDEPELAQQFYVSSIPMLVVMKNGEIANQSVGARPKAQILAMLED